MKPFLNQIEELLQQELSEHHFFAQQSRDQCSADLHKTKGTLQHLQLEHSRLQEAYAEKRLCLEACGRKANQLSEEKRELRRTNHKLLQRAATAEAALEAFRGNHLDCSAGQSLINSDMAQQERRVVGQIAGAAMGIGAALGQDSAAAKANGFTPTQAPDQPLEVQLFDVQWKLACANHELRQYRAALQDLSSKVAAIADPAK